MSPPRTRVKSVRYIATGVAGISEHQEDPRKTAMVRRGCCCRRCDPVACLFFPSPFAVCVFSSFWRAMVRSAMFSGMESGEGESGWLLRFDL